MSLAISYVKRFEPVRLGTVRLGKGRDPLVLRALKITGEEAVDVRWLELVRTPRN